MSRIAFPTCEKSDTSNQEPRILFFHVWAVRQVEDFIQGWLARFRAQAIALRVWREQIVFIRISSIVNIESSCLGESHEWKAFRYPRFFEVSFGFYLSSFAFYEAAFFQWLLFDHIWLNKACHNLRRVFNLSMYITNIIPHGKCFVRCLHTRWFVSEIERVREANEWDFWYATTRA